MTAAAGVDLVDRCDRRVTAAVGRYCMRIAMTAAAGGITMDTAADRAVDATVTVGANTRFGLLYFVCSAVTVGTGKLAVRTGSNMDTRLVTLRADCFTGQVGKIGAAVWGAFEIAVAIAAFQLWMRCRYVLRVFMTR